jgi:hypothetical protein
MNEQQLQQILEQLPPEVIMILLQLPSEILALFAQLTDQDKAEIMQMIEGQQPAPPQDTGNQALFG